MVREGACPLYIHTPLHPFRLRLCLRLCLRLLRPPPPRECGVTFRTYGVFASLLMTVDESRLYTHNNHPQHEREDAEH